MIATGIFPFLRGLLIIDFQSLRDSFCAVFPRKLSLQLDLVARRAVWVSRLCATHSARFRDWGLAEGVGSNIACRRRRALSEGRRLSNFVLLARKPAEPERLYLKKLRRLSSIMGRRNWPMHSLRTSPRHGWDTQTRLPTGTIAASPMTTLRGPATWSTARCKIRRTQWLKWGVWS